MHVRTDLYLHPTEVATQKCTTIEWERGIKFVSETAVYIKRTMPGSRVRITYARLLWHGYRKQKKIKKQPKKRKIQNSFIGRSLKSEEIARGEGRCVGQLMSELWRLELRGGRERASIDVGTSPGASRRLWCPTVIHTILASLFSYSLWPTDDLYCRSTKKKKSSYLERVEVRSARGRSL